MRRLSGVIAAAVLAAGILAAVFVQGFAVRVGADLWPPDRSYVGPNLVASIIQWAIVAIVVAIVYPPFRKWVERELDHVHQKLDHVIKHHPDIPPFKRKETK